MIKTRRRERAEFHDARATIGETLFVDVRVKFGWRERLTADAQLFAEAVTLGNEVVWVH